MMSATSLTESGTMITHSIHLHTLIECGNFSYYITITMRTSVLKLLKGLSIERVHLRTWNRHLKSTNYVGLQ